MDNWKEQFEKEFSRLAENRLMAMPNYEHYMVASTVKVLLFNDLLPVIQSLLDQQARGIIEMIPDEVYTRLRGSTYDWVDMTIIKESLKNNL